MLENNVDSGVIMVFNNPFGLAILSSKPLHTRAENEIGFRDG